MPDDTEQLANLLAAKPIDLARNLGGPWRRVNDDIIQPDRDWFASGWPMQVLIGVGETDICVAEPDFHGGLPDPRYLYPTRIVTWPDRYATEAGSLVREAVEDAAQRGRATFNYCRFCRAIAAPEDRIDETTCSGCASRYLGVDF